jgi:hypothetical protein
MSKTKPTKTDRSSNASFPSRVVLNRGFFPPQQWELKNPHTKNRQNPKPFFSVFFYHVSWRFSARELENTTQKNVKNYILHMTLVF